MSSPTEACWSETNKEPGRKCYFVILSPQAVKSLAARRGEESADSSVVHLDSLRMTGEKKIVVETKEQKVLDLTSGNVTRNIFRLAWPAVTSMFLETFFSIANAFWVGKLGATYLAAVISSVFVIWIIYSLAAIISTGVVALVSRSIGAKDSAQASFISEQAFLFALIGSSLLAVMGILLTPQFFILMGTPPEVTAIGTKYLRIIFLGAPLFFQIDTLSGVFRASGDTKTPLRVALIAVGLNIILDPILIFGLGPFPKLGAIGASIATVISQFIGVVLFWRHINKGKLPFKLDLRIRKKLDLKTPEDC